VNGIVSFEYGIKEGLARIGGNSIVKNSKKFSERNAKNFA